MRIGILGAGAVGARTARQASATAEVDAVCVADSIASRADRVAAAIHTKVTAVDPAALGEHADVVVLATPAPQAPDAETHLRAGRTVVSTSDDWADVEALFKLGKLAERRGTALVLGATFAPGMTCLLARHAAGALDRVDEIHIAKHGTGGPACARQHHDALAGTGRAWLDGSWVTGPAGSGRELSWFPDPIGARDCYRAEVPDPLLLLPCFPGVQRVSARTSATRRDRLTARLPMLRPPHPEGGLGAIRVEVRGDRGGTRAVEVLGAMDRAGIAAGAVAAVAAITVARPGTRTGAFGLADVSLPTVELLTELARRGVKAARFVGGGGMSATW
jgi:saccharopine dehydrogenase-like NADP-dependent oxidoreductase